MALRLLALAALLATALTAPAAAKPDAAKRLKRFRSCDALVGYAARHVPRAPVRRELPPATFESLAGTGWVAFPQPPDSDLPAGGTKPIPR